MILEISQSAICNYAMLHRIAYPMFIDEATVNTALLLSCREHVASASMVRPGETWRQWAKCEALSSAETGAGCRGTPRLTCAGDSRRPHPTHGLFFRTSCTLSEGHQS